MSRVLKMRRRLFRTGEIILDSGIYRVHHQNHRLPHEITLIAGYEFPRCGKCRDAVEFEAVRIAPESFHQNSIVLYELPEIDGAEVA